jgi:hypothetical protein
MMGNTSPTVQACVVGQWLTRQLPPGYTYLEYKRMGCCQLLQCGHQLCPNTWVAPVYTLRHQDDIRGVGAKEVKYTLPRLSITPWK